MKSKRIGNLAFRPANYLGEPPSHPSWSIDLFYENPYYGKENEYPEDKKDSNYRIDPKYPSHRIHKSCFKSKESCFTIASFDYNKCWELHFIGDRPIEYLNTPELREIFWELIKYGNEQIYKIENDK